MSVAESGKELALLNPDFAQCLVAHGWQSFEIFSDHQFRCHPASLGGPVSSVPKRASRPPGRNSALDLGNERTLRRPDAMQKCNSVQVEARDRDDLYSIRANSLPRAYLNVSRAMRSRKLTGRWEGFGPKACGGELRALERFQLPGLFVVPPHCVEHLLADVTVRVVEPDGYDDRAARPPSRNRPCSGDRPQPTSHRVLPSATLHDGETSGHRLRASPQRRGRA